MIFQEAEKYPPCMCRLAARKSNGWKPMSISDIARESGLSKSYVAILAYRETWKGIPIDKVEAFTKACGVDLTHPNTLIDYLKDSKMAYLRSCGIAQRKSFSKIFAITKSANRKQSA